MGQLFLSNCVQSGNIVPVVMYTDVLFRMRAFRGITIGSSFFPYDILLRRQRWTIAFYYEKT